MALNKGLTLKEFDMRNMKWFQTRQEAMRFAKKVKGIVFRFNDEEMKALETDCRWYVRWMI